MTYRYYPYSCARIEKTIHRFFKGMTPHRQALSKIEALRKTHALGNWEEPLCRHILWMILEIQDCKDGEKRGRWMGYIYGWMESMSLISNRQSRNMARRDVQSLST